MKQPKSTYEALSEVYTDEEIVESFVFEEEGLDAAEGLQAENDFRALRLQRLQQMTEAQLRYGRLMKLKLGIQRYLKAGHYQESYSFHAQLKVYAQILHKPNKAFALDIDVHPTKFSRIINGREAPNIDIMYRLEEHSRGEIPAHHWWRLYALQLEHSIKTDLERRVAEAKKVKNQIQFPTQAS